MCMKVYFVYNRIAVQIWLNHYHNRYFPNLLLYCDYFNSTLYNNITTIQWTVAMLLRWQLLQNHPLRETAWTENFMQSWKNHEIFCNSYFQQYNYKCNSILNTVLHITNMLFTLPYIDNYSLYDSYFNAKSILKYQQPYQ